ncbi:hypothetical protein KC335_g14525, partial [Hortaea werneckii]
MPMSFDSLVNFSLLPFNLSNTQHSLDNMADVMSRKDLKTMVPQPKAYKKPP